MAHSVTVNLKEHPLSREENGVTFTVFAGEERLGELIVSKGGLKWKPKGKQDNHRIKWGGVGRCNA
jgi:hypothetical protein